MPTYLPPNLRSPEIARLRLLIRLGIVLVDRKMCARDPGARRWVQLIQADPTIRPRRKRRK